MPYLYGDIKDAKVGDVVESLTSNEEVTAGKLYVILKSSNNGSLGHYINDKGERSNGIRNSANFWKLVLTKPGAKAVKGDEIITVAEPSTYRAYNQIFTAYEDASNALYFTAYLSTSPDNFRVLCKATAFTNAPRVAIVTHDVSGHPIGAKIIQKGEDWILADGSSDSLRSHSIGNNCEWLDKLTSQHNIAYYKRSGAPWTLAEFKNIPGAKGVDLSHSIRKWVFPNNAAEQYNYTWIEQERHPYFKNCIQIAYEDVFGTSDAQLTPDKTDTVFILSTLGTLYEITTTAPNHITKITNLCNEVLAEQAVHCALTTTNSQEATMPQNSISININGNTINLDGIAKPKKVKTDLKLSPECISLWYNGNGAFVRQTNDTAKQAKKLLQKVANIGYTVRTYTISDAATTSIPVVNVAI